MFELVEHVHTGANIKVIGVGGAGSNAVNTMIRTRVEGVGFVAANTDLQALHSSHAHTKIQVGCQLTKGLGAGSNPEVGKNAALEDQNTIIEALTGADMVFITAGMGGGTGTGGAPVIAKLAKELGALTVGVVTKPFAFEGKRRGRVADEGINELKKEVDTLITIPNEKLLAIAGHDMPLIETFKRADEVLLQAVKGISDLITIQGLINLDFADVKTVMSNMGMALMGTGISSGDDRAVDAATRAVASPLLENVSIRGATGILINITGGPNMTLYEVNEASKLIQEEADEDANIIFGAVIDEAMGDEIRVTVIATGFDKSVRLGKMPIIRTSAPMRSSTTSMPVRPISQPAVESRLALTADSSEPVVVTETVERPSYHAERTTERVDRLERVEKASLRELVDEIGVLADFQEDEYDIPTFLRKQAD